LTETELVSFHKAGNFAPDRIRSFLRHFRSTQSPQSYYLEPTVGPVFYDGRRSERVALRLILLVRLETLKRKSASTQAFIVAVNAHGGQLRSPFRMAVDQKITLVNPETGKEVECRVVRVERTVEGDYLGSSGFPEPNPSFWPMSHPGWIEAKSRKPVFLCFPASDFKSMWHPAPVERDFATFCNEDPGISLQESFLLPSRSDQSKNFQQWTPSVYLRI
jgi:hypothetical protein